MSENLMTFQGFQIIINHILALARYFSTLWTLSLGILRHAVELCNQLYKAFCQRIFIENIPEKFAKTLNLVNTQFHSTYEQHVRVDVQLIYIWIKMWRIIRVGQLNYCMIKPIAKTYSDYVYVSCNSAPFSFVFTYLMDIKFVDLSQ